MPLADIETKPFTAAHAETPMLQLLLTIAEVDVAAMLQMLTRSRRMSLELQSEGCCCEHEKSASLTSMCRR